MDHLKLIKSLVFLFTFLLIAGSMLLIGLFAYKIRNADKYSAEINLQEPEGSVIRQMTATEEGMLYIQASEGGKPDRIIIYNLPKQQKLSTINIY